MLDENYRYLILEFLDILYCFNICAFQIGLDFFGIIIEKY